MNRVGSLCASIVMGLTLVGAAQATPMPDAGAMPPHGDAMTPPASDQSDTPRVVSGRVLKVDANEGTLVIQTPIGILALRGPSQDLRDVSVGDLVQVEMIDNDSSPSASPQLDDDDEDDN